MFKENKKSFAKDFMVITRFSYNGKFKIRNTEKKSKLLLITIKNIF